MTFYEIHHTLQYERERAKEFAICAKNNKAIPMIIQMQRSNSHLSYTSTDFVTAKTIWADNIKDVYYEIAQLNYHFATINGFNVVRNKIEIPAIENKAILKMANTFHHFESHYDVKDSFMWTSFSDLPLASSRIFDFDGKQNIIVRKNKTITLRSYKTDFERFRRYSNSLSDFLGIETAKVEYCLYDTNPNHDLPWLGNFES